MNGYMFQMAFEKKRIKSTIINIIMISLILIFSPWMSISIFPANCIASILKFCKEPLYLIPLGGS